VNPHQRSLLSPQSSVLVFTRNFSAGRPFVYRAVVAVPEGAVVSTFGFDLASTVSQAQLGDQVAFDAIYDRFADALFRYLYVRCGDAALAEELTGDLWVRVVERLPAFRFPGGDAEAAFAGWLYRIARNLVIDSYRRRRHALVPLSETLSAHDAAPEEHVIAGDDRRELRAAIEQLTAEQREVLLLRFVEERTNAEVALLTGRSENAVKVMQHRALGALSRLLGGRRSRLDS
jgi:RNA polymerase sigma-70 factor (ECF subfamily)